MNLETLVETGKIKDWIGYKYAVLLAKEDGVILEDIQDIEEKMYYYEYAEELVNSQPSKYR